MLSDFPSLQLGYFANSKAENGKGRPEDGAAFEGLSD
ncbi:MAG: hypothetical protein ACI8TF_000539 [Paracoccaceae bacterium]|jgi:hypothetical protein